MSLSTYGAQQWAGLMVGIGSLPASFYLALCSDEPGIGWDGTVLTSVEPPATVGSGSYARVPVGFGSASWALAEAGYALVTVDLVFPTPDLDWGALPYFAFTDDPVAGNLWGWEGFVDPIIVTAGSTVVVPAGSLALELTNLLASIAE